MLGWLARQTDGIASRISVWRRTRAWKWATRLLALVAIVASALYLGPQLLAGVRQMDWTALRSVAGPATLSVVLTAVCVMLGGLNWYLILRGLGYNLALARCMRIHTGSNLAGYVPGYAWKYLGKAYLTGKEGVPARAVATALGFEFAESLLSGLLISLALVRPGMLDAAWPPWWWAARIILAAFSMAALCVAPRLASRAGRAREADQPETAIHRGRRGALWGAMAVMLCSWLLYGSAHALLFSGWTPLPSNGWAVSVFSLTSSYVVSLMALFVPGGLGIREAVIARSLGTIASPEVAAMVAVAARFALILSEIVAFGVSCFWAALVAHGRGSGPARYAQGEGAPVAHSG